MIELNSSSSRLTIKKINENIKNGIVKKVNNIAIGLSVWNILKLY